MITDQYKAQLVELHAKQKWGAQGWKCLPDVLRAILELKAHTPSLLDYGAGEQTLKKTAEWALPQVRVTSFDPGIPGIDKMPSGVFDIVTCTDVLEHIEPQFVDKTLDTLRRYTKGAAILYIACTPAKTMLPDGRNAHLTVESPEWWLPKLQSRWSEINLMKSSAKLLAVTAYA
jgi:hypothetical protein